MSNRCHFSLMMMTAKTDLTKIQANDAKKIANVFIFQRFSTVGAVWFYKNISVFLRLAHLAFQNVKL